MLCLHVSSHTAFQLWICQLDKLFSCLFMKKRAWIEKMWKCSKKNSRNFNTNKFPRLIKFLRWLKKLRKLQHWNIPAKWENARKNPTWLKIIFFHWLHVLATWKIQKQFKIGSVKKAISFLQIFTFQRVAATTTKKQKHTKNVQNSSLNGFEKIILKQHKKFIAILKDFLTSEVIFRRCFELKYSPKYSMKLHAYKVFHPDRLHCLRLIEGIEFQSHPRKPQAFNQLVSHLSVSQFFLPQTCSGFNNFVCTSVLSSDREGSLH